MESAMADQAVTQGDLANLAKKLDEVSDVLTDKEKALLLAVFKLAGEAISARLQGAASSGEKESGSMRAGAMSARSTALSDGFRGAFQSIGKADFNLRSGIENVAGGVGIGVIW
jgi:hypothetical protein